jgi:hypothetical protein
MEREAFVIAPCPPSVLVNLSRLTVSQMTAVSTDESHHQRLHLARGARTRLVVRWRDRIGAPALAALADVAEETSSCRPLCERRALRTR